MALKRASYSAWSSSPMTCSTLTPLSSEIKLSAKNPCWIGESGRAVTEFEACGVSLINWGPPEPFLDQESGAALLRCLPTSPLFSHMVSCLPLLGADARAHRSSRIEATLALFPVSEFRG